MPSLNGHLLVASPHLHDSNFARAVVLMIQHSDEGAFGIVLNHPSEHSLAEVWESVADEACSIDKLLMVGGPVQGPLLALHTRLSVAEREILPGLYFSAQREALHSLITDPEDPFAIFSGYSGWGAGQLEHELKEGSWLTTDARFEHVFPELDIEHLWKSVTNEIGRSVLAATGTLRNAPSDPSVN